VEGRCFKRPDVATAKAMKEKDENQQNQKPMEAGEKEQKGKDEANPAAENQAGEDELSPEADSKKEEISGYNEHPDQAKVGGG
jgi:hypothetical protein